MKQTIKLKESQLKNMVREALNELNWKTYMDAARKRLAQGKDANARELADMAKSRFDDEYNDNYKYDTLGDKLAGKHSKTFDSTFTDLEAPEVRGRNEKGEDLFRVKGKYYNSNRGVTTPEKFFGDKNMTSKFNTATKELDDYNSGAYGYTDEKGWHLKESQLRAIIKEGIQKVLNENERHEIFTLDIFDIENEDGIDDMQYACDYESEDEAIQAAREVAQKYADMDTVINVFVMAGEYMDAQGNVLGEPDAIYCVSNKDRETTMQARTNAGYSNPEANEYVGKGQIG